MPFTPVSKNAALAAMSANVSFIGVHTLVDPGLTSTAAAGEASGGSYVRQAVTWATASGALQANSNALTIPVPAGTFGFLTFWNASTLNTGTQYFGYSPMGGASAIKGFAVTDPTFANKDFFCDSHGLANGDQLFLYPEFGGSTPTGVSTGTLYFVVGTATNTFQLATTSGGAAVTVSTTSPFFWQRIVPETFNAPGNITVAIGALVLDSTAM